MLIFPGQSAFPRLFAAALLSSRRDVDAEARSRIVAGIQADDEADPRDIASVISSLLENSPPNWPSIRRIGQAAAKVRTWLERGVYVAVADDMTVGPPAVFFVQGPPEVFARPRTAILNSRKSRQPFPADRWIRVTKKLAGRAAADGHAIVTSVGANHWELPAFYAGAAGGYLMLVCDDLLPVMRPAAKRNDFIDKYNDMASPERTVILSPFPPGRLPAASARRVRRDECVVGISDRLMAAEIRTGGNMARLAEPAIEKGRAVIVYRPERFTRSAGGNGRLLDIGAIPWDEPEPKTLPIMPAPAPVRKAFPARSAPALTVPDGRKFLIHFTRRRQGPWPGQSPSDYYASLTEGRDTAGHTAFDTLRRILDEGLVRGGSRLVRGGRHTVSLTACGLSGLKYLVRWRRALARWTVEPYGLALARGPLYDLGAKPAIYGGEAVWRRLPEKHRFRFQLHNPPRTKWKPEREWRLPGDLDLSRLRPEDVLAIVPTEEEAARIMESYGLDVVLSGGFV